MPELGDRVKIITSGFYLELLADVEGKEGIVEGHVTMCGEDVSVLAVWLIDDEKGLFAYSNDVEIVDRNLNYGIVGIGSGLTFHPSRMGWSLSSVYPLPVDEETGENMPDMSVDTHGIVWTGLRHTYDTIQSISRNIIANENLTILDAYIDTASDAND